jgi:hypothetical protein
MVEVRRDADILGIAQGITRIPRNDSPHCGLLEVAFDISRSKVGLDDHAIAGYAVRTASALEESGFCDRSGAVPGFGRWRDHGDF